MAKRYLHLDGESLLVENFPTNLISGVCWTLLTVTDTQKKIYKHCESILLYNVANTSY